MIGAFLLLGLIFIIALRLPGTNPANRLARAGALALMTPVLALVVLAALGVTLSSWATLGLLTACILVFFPWRSSYPLSQEDWGILTLATLVCFTGAAALVAKPFLHDLYAHMAWSKNLAAAQDYYPLGFPALFHLTGSGGWPLITSLRVAPVILGIVFALQCIAIGDRFGSRTAGALAAAAYMFKSLKADPSLPEFFAVILMTATWRELVIFKPPSSLKWIPLLCFATVVVHISVFEIVHFGILACALLLVLKQPLSIRAGALSLAALGALGGILISPMARGILFGAGPLLTSQQPGELDPFNPRSLAWSWGYGFVLAFGASLLFFFKDCFKDDRWKWVLLFSLGSALLLAPTILMLGGVEIPLQMYAGRQYVAALMLAVLAWLVLISGAPKVILAGFALLLAGQIAHSSGFDIPRLLIAGVGLGLIVFVAPSIPDGQKSWAFVLFLFAAVGIRLFLWAPQAPPWAAWIQHNAPSGSVVMTNWPTVNPADALTDTQVLDGVAGADASLALHRLQTIPPYRHQLGTCDPSRAFANPLKAVLDSLGTDAAYIVIHEDYTSAWANYAGTHEFLKQRGELGQYSVYQAPPCPLPAGERLYHMNNELIVHSLFTKVYEDSRCSIYAYTQ